MYLCDTWAWTSQGSWPPGSTAWCSPAPLSDFGLSRAQAERLRRDGWLTEVRRGVALVGGGRPSDWQKVVAAAMVIGAAGAVSHSTAARLHRFAGIAPGPAAGGIELTVPISNRQRLSDCTVHRVVRLPEDEVGPYRGVRVTKPIRTLIDIAPRLPVVVLEKTVDEGLIFRLWDEAALARAVAAAGGRAGIDTLRRLMAYRTSAPTPPRANWSIRATARGLWRVSRRVERAVASFIAACARTGQFRIDHPTRSRDPSAHAGR